MVLLARCEPRAAQQWGHCCYELYAAAHFLAHVWYTRKFFVPGLPILPYPADFWHSMAERLWGRRCGQCHGHIAQLNPWRSWGPDVNALAHAHVVSYCDYCWGQLNTRRYVWGLTTAACSSQLGELLSVGPLAVRIIDFLVDDRFMGKKSPVIKFYCAACRVWIYGPILVARHSAGQCGL